MTAADGLERNVLEVISKSEGPVGSSVVHEQLELLGYTISEPTVGRFLRYLDRRKLTQRMSNRGRRLTAAGKRRLDELYVAHRRSEAEQHLLSAMRADSLDDLLDVLIARRAIERETARLAAAYASEDAIAEMEATIATQRELWRAGKPATAQDVQFHQQVASASGNRVLAAALDLIRQDQDLRERLKSITQHSGLEPGRYHVQLVEALRQRAPDAAERAIVAHMDDLIARVEAARAHAGRPNGSNEHLSPAGLAAAGR